jgi:hypothetical protein
VVRDGLGRHPNRSRLEADCKDGRRIEGSKGGGSFARSTGKRPSTKDDDEDEDDWGKEARGGSFARSTGKRPSTKDDDEDDLGIPALTGRGVKKLDNVPSFSGKDTGPFEVEVFAIHIRR